jgi:hypothetical protein
MITVFTICSNNYLAQAISLGNSLLEYNPNYEFIIGLVDRKTKDIDYNKIPFETIDVESIEINGFEEMILNYNITELNTAVKPFYFQYLFRIKPAIDIIIYCDPDILIYNQFEELEKEFEIYDIILTPHITNPINDDKYPSESMILNTGLYNLGFIAIKKTLNSILMINWWAIRLKNGAYIDLKNGMFTDQLWINLIPLFFERVKIFTHPGHNVAYWNLHERVLSQISDKFYVNNSSPLVFFHFSGFDPANPEQISKYQNRFSFKNRSDIFPLFKNYVIILDRNNILYYQNFNCIYSRIKEQYDDERVLQKILQIPIYKRAVRKVINFIISKFDILLDYSVFYKRQG